MMREPVSAARIEPWESNPGEPMEEGEGRECLQLEDACELLGIAFRSTDSDRLDYRR